MAADNVTDMPPPEGGTDKREQSTIAFPYMDMEDAIEIARGIHETTGASPCQQDQLAAKLQQSMNSSAFRMKLSAARLFGLTESDRSGAVRLTNLGQMIVDPAQQREAKVRSFLSVPLYNKLHEHYRGKMLPPTQALTRELVVLGVAQKQADRARQTFERSASTAGFFELGRDRLVAPGYAASEAPPPPEVKEPEEKRNGRGSGGGDFGGHDHLIIGLFNKLPPPETEWGEAERLKWLQTAANIFDLVYKGDCGGFRIVTARADRSPRPHDHE